MNDTEEIVKAAMVSKAWPFVEARKVLKRVSKRDSSQEVIFSTGFGPSGLPHIGTFGEVTRTVMVRNAFNLITSNKYKTRLYSFSDDMDALRKVPTNIPNQDEMLKYIGVPLSFIPDPFGKDQSFAHHTNRRLCEFLDGFGFDYEFLSATKMYAKGSFNKTLSLMLQHYDEIMDVMMPTLGEERRKTYALFFPYCKVSGKLLNVPILERDVKNSTITYRHPDTNDLVVTSIFDGKVKCQWKVDWALRWVALGVDYEMSGKDLYDSYELSGQIAKIIGSKRPDGFIAELFLDEDGKKISKSKGNGVSVDQWLKYATKQSLALFMYAKPTSAKKLYFHVIPKEVDNYLQFLRTYWQSDIAQQLKNPVWHIHGGNVPKLNINSINYSSLLNLARACQAVSRDELWSYITKYQQEATAADMPLLDDLVGYAVQFYEDFVAPNRSFRLPEQKEKAALEDLQKVLKHNLQASAEDIQQLIYEVGVKHDFQPLKLWFVSLYEILLGSSSGPRFGSFVKLYGVEQTISLLDRAINGSLAAGVLQKQPE